MKRILFTVIAIAVMAIPFWEMLGSQKVSHKK